MCCLSALPAIGSAFCFGKKASPFETNKQGFGRNQACARKSLTMIIYQTVFKKPQVANSLLGMSVEEFDNLYAEFERVYIGRESTLPYTRRNRLKRKRMIGAGRKHKYVLRDRLLMTLFWLRAYTTYEVLGVLYQVDKTTVEDYVKRVLDILTTMASFQVEMPHMEIPKLRSVQEVIEAFPDICLVVDMNEE